MPTYRQQRNVVVLALHRSADVGGIAPRRGRCTYVHFIQPQYVDLDRRYYGTPILYCTILHYTTLPVSIYLYFLRELVIRCATYLPTS